MTSVSASHIILTPTQPEGNGHIRIGDQTPDFLTRTLRVENAPPLTICIYMVIHEKYIPQESISTEESRLSRGLQITSRFLNKCKLNIWIAKKKRFYVHKIIRLDLKYHRKIIQMAEDLCITVWLRSRAVNDTGLSRSIPTDVALHFSCLRWTLWG